MRLSEFKKRLWTEEKDGTLWLMSPEGPIRSFKTNQAFRIYFKSLSNPYEDWLAKYRPDEFERWEEGRRAERSKTFRGTKVLDTHTGIIYPTAEACSKAIGKSKWYVSAMIKKSKYAKERFKYVE